MTILKVGKNEFNLDDMDKDELTRLANGLIGDVESHSFYGNAKQYDKARKAFDELIQYLIHSPHVHLRSSCNRR